MKECIACAEEIKQNALLCRHCGTRQDDESYESNAVDELPPILDGTRAVENEEFSKWARTYQVFKYVEADESEQPTDEVAQLTPEKIWTLVDTQDEGGVFAVSDRLAGGEYHGGLILGWFLAERSSDSRDQEVIVVDRQQHADCDGDGCKGCHGLGWLETSLFGGLSGQIDGLT